MRTTAVILPALFLAATSCIDSDYPFDTVDTGVDIEYSLESAGVVDVIVTDSYLGLVRTLLDSQEQESGSHSVNWDLADSSGQPVENGLYNVEVYLDGERVYVHVLEVNRQ